MDGAIVFARHGALPTWATSRTIRLVPGVDLRKRHRLHLRRRIHALRRHLHLHLVADARSSGSCQ